MNYLVGLTGGIGSGKSTVADMFAALGVRIIDTDLISHQLTQAGGEAIPAIRDGFGNEFIDAQGALDRSRMRELVFAQPAAMQHLKDILHPLILARTKKLAATPTDAPYTLVVVPLLFESGGYRDWLDFVVAVDCPEQTQVARAMQRSRLDEAAVRAIMAHQLARPERQRRADAAILNDSSLEALQAQVVGMHRRLSELAGKSN